MITNRGVSIRGYVGEKEMAGTWNQTNKMALFTVSDTYFNDSLTSSTDKIALPPMTVLASDCTLSGLHFRMGGASLRRRK